MSHGKSPSTKTFTATVLLVAGKERPITGVQEYVAKKKQCVAERTYKSTTPDIGWLLLVTSAKGKETKRSESFTENGRGDVELNLYLRGMPVNADLPPSRACPARLLPSFPSAQFTDRPARLSTTTPAMEADGLSSE